MTYQPRSIGWDRIPAPCFALDGTSVLPTVCRSLRGRPAWLYPQYSLGSRRAVLAYDIPPASRVWGVWPSPGNIYENLPTYFHRPYSFPYVWSFRFAARCLRGIEPPRAFRYRPPVPRERVPHALFVLIRAAVRRRRRYSLFGPRMSRRLLRA